jgi:sugar/nucleoside kinase (ribokinase family)
MARFGLAPRFVGRVGASDADRIEAELAAKGVTPCLAADADAETGRLIVILDPSGERSFLTDRGANERLCADDIPDEAVAQADFIQFSGYSLVCETTRVMMRQVIEKSRPTPFGFDPASASFIREIGADVFLSASVGAAAIFPNEDEAEALTGAADPAEQLATLARRFPLVVLKRGQLGCLAAHAGEVLNIPTPSIEAVDSTGAGDAFVAAFLAAHLTGSPLDAALRNAVEAGALAARTFGAGPP